VIANCDEGEINILFDVNSANLSDKAKADLKELAAKAKTFQGCIQVAGDADAQSAASAAGSSTVELDRRRSLTGCGVALSAILRRCHGASIRARTKLRRAGRTIVVQR
jgi:hypothetical protein